VLHAADSSWELRPSKTPLNASPKKPEHQIHDLIQLG